MRRALGRESLLVPPLWWYETANILRGAQRRGRLRSTQVERVFSLLADLLIVTDEQPGLITVRRIHDVALASGLSAYDAAYVELALRRNALWPRWTTGSPGPSAALGVAILR